MANVAVQIHVLLVFCFFCSLAWPRSVDAKGRQLHEVAREAHSAAEAIVEPSEHEKDDAGEDKDASEDEHVAEDEEQENVEEQKEILQFTIGLLLAGFVFFDVFLLYLVNFRDENIRSFIYKMLNSTMSIFLAVTMNQAAFAIWLEQILPAPPPRGFGMKVGELQEFIVGMAYFGMYFFGINLVGYYFKDQRKTLKAARIIMGHIAAFAGITTFGTVQIAVDRGNSIFCEDRLMLIGVVVVILFILKLLTQAMRNYYLINSSSYVPIEDDNQDRSWLEEVIEAEDDATSLILSFLLCQYAIWMVTGQFVPLPPHTSHDKYYDWQKVHTMGWVIAIFLAGLVIAFYLRQGTPNIKEAGGRDRLGWQMRFLAGFQALFAMAIAWSFLRIGAWVVALLVSGTRCDTHDMINIINAFALTIISVVVVICLDFFADRAQDTLTLLQDKARKAQRGWCWRCCVPSVSASSRSPRSAGSRTADSDTQRSMEMADTQDEHDKVIKSTMSLSHLTVPGVVDAFMEGLTRQGNDTRNLEKAIRTVIDSFGLLVGLCWETATDAALASTIEGFPSLRKHEVVTKICAAILVFATMFPSWLYFIMPHAEMSDEDWRMQIEIEQQSSEQTTLATSFRFVCNAVKEMGDDDAKSLLTAVLGAKLGRKVKLDVTTEKFQ